MFGNSSGSGLFGNNTNSTASNQSGGLFGSSNNSAVPNASNNSGSLFGANNNTAANNSFGAGTKPAGGLFGGNSNSGGMFGANNNSSSTAPAAAGGLFGANNNNNNNGSSGGLFGNNTNNSNNNTSSGGLFGNNTSNNNNNASGGLFSNNNNTNNTAQSNTGGGLFGNNANTQNNTSGGLFGSKPASSGGLFGANTNNTQTNTSGGLFGSNTTNNNTNGGLFGGNTSNNNTNGGLFGGNNNNNNSNTGGGLFGGNNNSNNTSGGLFGSNNNNNNNNTTGGLFGNQPNPQNQPQQQQQQGLFNQSNNINILDKDNVVYTPSINDQLIKIKEQWDPNSQSCKLKTHFYNKLNEQEINRLLNQPRPANESPDDWNKAMSERPSNQYYPVKITMFTDVSNRIEAQLEHVKKSRYLLNVINENQSKLSAKHDLDNTNRIKNCKIKHTKLSRRLLRLATILAILKLKGYPLLPEEEEISKQFELLNAKLDDPNNALSKLNDLFARLIILKEKSENMNTSLNQSINLMNDNLDDLDDVKSENDNNDELIVKVSKLLLKQQKGLNYINEIISKDLELADKLVKS